MKTLLISIALVLCACGIDEPQPHDVADGGDVCHPAVDAGTVFCFPVCVDTKCSTAIETRFMCCPDAGP